MDAQETFLAQISRFLKRTGMAEYDFGLQAMSDPNFIYDIRDKKRSPQLKTVERARAFMKNYRFPKKKKTKSKNMGDAHA